MFINHIHSTTLGNAGDDASIFMIFFFFSDQIPWVLLERYEAGIPMSL